MDVECLRQDGGWDLGGGVKRVVGAATLARADPEGVDGGGRQRLAGLP